MHKHSAYILVLAVAALITIGLVMLFSTGAYAPDNHGDEFSFLKKQSFWLGIGFLTADIGGIVLLVALVLGGIGIRRTRSGGGAGLLRASTALAAILIGIYVVAVWAMGGKPT